MATPAQSARSTGTPGPAPSGRVGLRPSLNESSSVSCTPRRPRRRHTRPSRTREHGAGNPRSRMPNAENRKRRVVADFAAGLPLLEQALHQRFGLCRSALSWPCSSFWRSPSRGAPSGSHCTFQPVHILSPLASHQKSAGQDSVFHGSNDRIGRWICPRRDRRRNERHSNAPRVSRNKAKQIKYGRLSPPVSARRAPPEPPRTCPPVHARFARAKAKP
jgi:hypothetical protein